MGTCNARKLWPIIELKLHALLSVSTAVPGRPSPPSCLVFLDFGWIGGTLRAFNIDALGPSRDLNCPNCCMSYREGVGRRWLLEDRGENKDQPSRSKPSRR